MMVQDLPLFTQPSQLSRGVCALSASLCLGQEPWGTSTGTGAGRRRREEEEEGSAISSGARAAGGQPPAPGRAAAASTAWCILKLLHYEIIEAPTQCPKDTIWVGQQELLPTSSQYGSFWS